MHSVIYILNKYISIFVVFLKYLSCTFIAYNVIHIVVRIGVDEKFKTIIKAQHICNKHLHYTFKLSALFVRLKSQIFFEIFAILCSSYI